MCIDSEDCRNAFNELDRQVIADTLKVHDYKLYLYFMAYYDRPALQLYRLADGSLVCPAKSACGLVQGDPLAALIYDIVYTLVVLKPMQEAYPDVVVCALHDDTYLVARVSVLPAASTKLTELAATAHLEFGAAKRKLLQLPGDHGALDAALFIDQFPAGLNLVRSTIKCGGVPVGAPEAVVSKCITKATHRVWRARQSCR